MATMTFQKIFGNLSSNKNVKNILSDFQKLSKELRQKGGKLNTRFTSEKAKTMQQARSQYKKILTKVGISQKQLDREVGKALSLIKKSAADVEKNLQFYRNKATEQSHKIEKMILKKKPGAPRAASKTTKKKTARKTARKATRKTV